MSAVVRLTGCAATPLGSYLKALGVLRLISEQKDDRARGFWDGDIFCLDTELSVAAMERFFLEEYRPTPIVAPWNGGSGFYPKDNREGIEAIETSTSARFALYRETIALCRQFPDVQRGKIEKDPNAEDQRRTSILLSCRNELPDQAIDWLDAAVGIDSTGSRAFAPVLGTGGNEGRLDYTNNFMGRLAGLIISPDKKTPVLELLRNSLFGDRTEGLQDGAAGQYDPGRAGGANQGQGIEQKSGTNPWELILTLEGAVSWASGLYRRQGVSYRSYLCSPFTVAASRVGYGSSSSGEEARAEIWVPLWSSKARYSELRILLREGRASVTGNPARTGLEFAEAATSLGVDRSIDRFVRYSLLKRRGDSYVALPAGTFLAGYRRGSDRIRQVRDIADQIGGQTLPKDCAILKGRLDQAMFEALLRDEPQRVREAFAALGRLLRAVVTRTEIKFPWRSSNGLEWLHACDPCPEARIAASLASLHDAEAGHIRSNLQRYTPKSQRSEFTWQGKDVAHRLMSVLERRMKAYSWDEKSRPFAGAVSVHASDLSLFIEGRTDDDLIEDLLFAFLCFDWSQDCQLPGASDAPRVLPAYAALKYLFQPRKLRIQNEEKQIVADTRIPALLRAGQNDRAVELATNRLWIAGLIPYKRQYSTGAESVRLGAALLVPAWDFGQAIRERTQNPAKA